MNGCGSVLACVVKWGPCIEQCSSRPSNRGCLRPSGELGDIDDDDWSLSFLSTVLSSLATATMLCWTSGWLHASSAMGVLKKKRRARVVREMLRQGIAL